MLNCLHALFVRRNVETHLVLFSTTWVAIMLSCYHFKCETERVVDHQFNQMAEILASKMRELLSTALLNSCHQVLVGEVVLVSIMRSWRRNTDCHLPSSSWSISTTRFTCHHLCISTNSKKPLSQLRNLWHSWLPVFFTSTCTRTCHFPPKPKSESFSSETEQGFTIRNLPNSKVKV